MGTQTLPLAHAELDRMHAYWRACNFLAAKAGGIDALVFSGGIGEHASAIRSAICTPQAFIGISLNDDAKTFKRNTA